MSRRHRAEKRKVPADFRYQSELLSRFINRVMLDGKKNIARKIVYNALDRFVKKIKEADPVQAFEQVLENAKPSLEIRTQRIGGANYQIPVEIPPDRRTSLAMRWIITHAREKAGKNMSESLAIEFIDCYNNQGVTIKKKDETHRMAEANRAFAHYKR